MRYQPVDLSEIKHASSIQHKVQASSIVNLPLEGASAWDLIQSFPDSLGASSFRRVVKAIVDAVRKEKPVVAAIGGHVVKVGCSPIIIDMMERGIISGIACNGSVAIHDFELSSQGSTSEDVIACLHSGKFGMSHETIEFFRDIAGDHRDGLGWSIGRLLSDRQLHTKSIFRTAYELDIPACVHIAVGTDTIHMGGIDVAALAAGSMYDFRLLCDVVSNLGVWLNIGSAVILPEVFLKAVTVARNLGADLDDMVTANFDMIRHYRTTQNVVTRPVRPGNGYDITGHHEIMLPLLRQAVIEELYNR